MPLPKPKPTCTAEDYWTLPQGQRAELIDGELWDLAAPSGTHQEIEAELVTDLRLFIRSHGGPCKVFPAPYAVNLFADDTTFVEPDVSVICDPQQQRVLAYTFDSEAIVQIYTFSTPVPSTVFPGFEFDFDRVLAGM